MASPAPMFTHDVVFATPPFALINATFLNHSPQVRPSRIGNHTLHRCDLHLPGRRERGGRTWLQTRTKEGWGCCARVQLRQSFGILCPRSRSSRTNRRRVSEARSMASEEGLGKARS